MALTKKKIVDFLKSKGSYDEVYAYLIDEFLFNLDLADMAKEDIKTRGSIVDFSKDGSLKNSNPSVNVYMAAVKQVMTISSKLGLDFKSITQLKVQDKEEDDGF